MMTAYVVLRSQHSFVLDSLIVKAIWTDADSHDQTVMSVPVHSHYTTPGRHFN